MTRAILDPPNVEAEWIEVILLTPLMEMLSTGVMSSTATEKAERIRN